MDSTGQETKMFEIYLDIYDHKIPKSVIYDKKKKLYNIQMYEKVLNYTESDDKHREWGYYSKWLESLGLESAKNLKDLINEWHRQTVKIASKSKLNSSE